MANLGDTLDGRIDAFWKKTLEEVSLVPLEGSRAEYTGKEWHPYSIFDVSYRSWGGRLIRGRMGVPVNGVKTPTAAIISGPGYGGWQQPVELAECQRGFVILQIFPRDQGMSGTQKLGEPRQGPEQLVMGLDSPENFYYRGAYVDMIRGVDFLLSCPEVDKNRIGAMASSQGGALVLAAGALDPRVKAVVAHVPAFCDMRNNASYARRNHEIRRHLDLFDYFDPANLASRCKCPTLLSSGGKDEPCPAESIATAYARLAGIRSIVHYPEMTHSPSADFFDLGWQWLRRYL